MTLDSAAAAFQACSNQTSNMLANWECSYDQPHMSTASSAGYTFGHTLPLAIGVLVVLAILIAWIRARHRAAAPSS